MPFEDLSLGEGGSRTATARGTAESVARQSYGKLVAFLATRTRDVAAAEDALAEAFAAALADWPKNGCPASPEAWLLAVARRRSIDGARRRQTREAASAELVRLAERAAEAAPEAIPDRRLALLFVCAHPAIEEGIRAPLMLQAVLGFDAERIGSAFLVAPATMGKRLVRAKEKIRHGGIAFRVPERDELAGRVGAVLDAIYACFGAGWSDPGGTEVADRELTGEALFLARLVAELLPEEPEALGLLSLMLHSDARRRARRNGAGDFVPFAEQDTALWDWPAIGEAEALLRRASALATRRLRRFELEAALQSAHVERRATGAANWQAVVEIYDALLELTGSAVVEINRAVALAEVAGAAAGLAALDGVAADAAERRIADYQPYWAARADLLARTGAGAEAARAYERAIGLAVDPAVRRFLQRRQAALPR